MNAEFATTDDTLIFDLGNQAKQDAKALKDIRHEEAMRLFRFWRKCCKELNMRHRARHIMAMGCGYTLN